MLHEVFALKLHIILDFVDLTAVWFQNSPEHIKQPFDGSSPIVCRTARTARRRPSLHNAPYAQAEPRFKEALETMGLRRAFVLAGAKTLVMSLWKVPDLTTLIMIQRFYDNLTERALPRDQSLREAQCYVRDLTIGRIRDPWLTAGMIERLAGGDQKALKRLQDLAAKGDDHRPFELPYYWGAFICQGDPSALPSRAG